MFRTNKSKWLLTLIAFILVAGVLVAFGVKLNKQEKTVSVNSFNYSIGALNSSGKVVESKKSIYTKNLAKVDGLEIEIEEDATITYKVAFYDEHKDFISITNAKSTDLESADIPQD